MTNQFSKLRTALVSRLGELNATMLYEDPSGCYASVVLTKEQTQFIGAADPNTIRTLLATLDDMAAGIPARDAEITALQAERDLLRKTLNDMHAGIPARDAEIKTLTPAARDVLAERQRQTQIGYDSTHDDEHVNDEIAAVAACYIMPPAARDWPALETGYGATFGEALVPGDWSIDHHPDRRVELVRGVAMGLAEIERLDRATMQQGG